MSGECGCGQGYPNMDVAYYVFLLSLGLLGTYNPYTQGYGSSDCCHESDGCHGSDPPAGYPVPVRRVVVRPARPLTSPFGVWRWGAPPPPPQHPMNTMLNMAKPYLGNLGGPFNSVFSMFTKGS